MSTTTIAESFKVGGVATDMTSVKLSNQGGTYGVTRTDLSNATANAATKADPCVITTAAAHGYSDGQFVNISAVVGMTQLNGNNYYVDVLTTTTFALYSDSDLATTVDSSGYTTYASAGTITPLVVADGTALTKTATGVYQYSFTDPAADLTYQYVLEIVYDGETFWITDTMLGTPTAPGTLIFTFQNIWEEVGRSLKNTAAPTGDALAECKKIANRGYLTFLAEWPWTFMHPDATLAVTTADDTTDLPADFGEMRGDFRFAPDAGLGRTKIERTTYENIRVLKTASENEAGTPLYYAILPKTHVLATGQRSCAMWYPVPDADLTLYYPYRAEAAELVNDNDYPLGGQKHAMAIVQAAKAIAEQWKHGTCGKEWKLYCQENAERVAGRQVGGLLLASIRRDLADRPKNLGYNADRSDVQPSADPQMSEWTYST